MLLVPKVNLEMQNQWDKLIFSAKKGHVHSDVTVDGRNSASQGVLNFLYRHIFPEFDNFHQPL